MALNGKTLGHSFGLTPVSADPTNPVEGDFQFSDGTVRAKGLWQYYDGDWQEIAGGGGGGLDNFYTQDFEAFDVDDITTGQNATYRVAGTFGGVLSLETVNHISGLKSLKYTAGAASTNDWFDIAEITLSRKQHDDNGVYVTVIFYDDSALFSTDKEFVFYDVTNSAKLSVAAQAMIIGGTGLTRYTLTVLIPATCLVVSFGCHMTEAPVNGESFLLDDFEFTTSTAGAVKIINVSSGPFNVLSIHDGALFLLDLTSAAITMNLPYPARGFRVGFKDLNGMAGTNAMTLNRFAAEEIENLASNYVAEAPYFIKWLVADGTNWVFE